MKIVEKVITGYATTYTTAYQYSSSYPWADIPNAFDWSPSNTSWKDTYATARIYWNNSSSSSNWYLDGIGSFKSFLDDNFDDAYGKTGQEYSNFSCLPDSSELTKIVFLVRSSAVNHKTESVKYYKNGVDVTYQGSSTTQLTYKKASSSDMAVTENLVSDGTVLSTVGQIFDKNSSGTFVWERDTTVNIGTWSINDFKKGLFQTRVSCRSHSVSGSSKYWGVYCFAVKLYCKIPQYEVIVSTNPGGTVTGGGYYFSGRTTTITASPSLGYKFKGWRVNGVFSRNTSTSMAFVVEADTIIEALFERESCIMYDTVFSYKKWQDSGITTSMGTISNITEEGFTFTSNHNGNDGYTDESPKFKVKPDTKYIIDFDCEGSGWEVFVFFHPENATSWNAFKTTVEKSTEFVAPSDCAYITIRLDANAAGNAVRLSNIRVYPADYEYMSNTVQANQRTDIATLSLPDRVIRNGYLFDGWNTEIDGSGIRYENDTTFPQSNVTVYSQWLLPIMFRGKFAKNIHNNGKTTNSLKLNGKVFPENPLYIPVKFLNYDGSLFYTKPTLFGHMSDASGVPTPTKPPDEEIEYQFSHWEGEFGKVRGVQEFLAQYTLGAIRYSVKFGYYNLYNEFVTLSSQRLTASQFPSIPDATRSPESKDSTYYVFDFIGWDKEVLPVTEDVVYVAKYNTEQFPIYTVTWNIKEKIFTTQVPLGLMPIPPSGYNVGDEFLSSDNLIYRITGFTPVFTAITGDTAYTASYEIKTISIVWKYHDIIDTQTVNYGSTPTPPYAAGQTFSTNDATITINSWKPAIQPATENTTYTANISGSITKRATGYYQYSGGFTGGHEYVYDGNVDTYAYRQKDSDSGAGTYCNLEKYGFKLDTRATITSIDTYTKISGHSDKWGVDTAISFWQATVTKEPILEATLVEDSTAPAQYYKRTILPSSIFKKTSEHGTVPTDNASLVQCFNNNSFRFILDVNSNKSIFEPGPTDIRVYDNYVTINFSLVV